MNTDAYSYLNQPLLLPPRQAIRVAVYSRLAAGIRSGMLPSGTLLPKESELATMLGVSRTPVREALILLEEDGLIITKRGIGRFVADSLPSTGLEQIRPFEQTLAETGDVGVKPLKFLADKATEFVADHMGIAVGADVWFRESLLTIDGRPGAIVQEHIRSGYDPHTGFDLDTTLRQASDDHRTMLATIIDSQSTAFDAGECRLAVSTAGRSRATLLDVSDDDPVLVMTETISCKDTPIYLGKYIVIRNVNGLSIIQSAM